MPDYKVLLTRDVTESAMVNVTAQDKHSAYLAAYDQATEEGADWDINADSCGRNPPYLGDCIENDVMETERKPVLPARILLPVNIEIDKAVDWIITALEGGIGYWSRRFEYEPRDLYLLLLGKQIPGVDTGLYTSFEFWERGGGIRLFDVEDNTPFEKRLTMEAIVEALPQLHPEAIDRLINEQYDIEDADVLIQFAVFGEVVFG